jgi:hypothetical protein
VLRLGWGLHCLSKTVNELQQQQQQQQQAQMEPPTNSVSTHDRNIMLRHVRDKT